MRKLGALDREVKKLVAKISDAGESDLGPLEAEVSQVQQSSDEALKAGARVIQSCELVFAKVAKRKRSEYLSERRQHIKVRDALVRGKLEATTAKVLCAPLAKCLAASIEASGPQATLPISIDAEPSHRDWRCVAA